MFALVKRFFQNKWIDDALYRCGGHLARVRTNKCLGHVLQDSMKSLGTGGKRDPKVSVPTVGVASFTIFQSARYPLIIQIVICSISTQGLGNISTYPVVRCFALPVAIGIEFPTGTVRFGGNELQAAFWRTGSTHVLLIVSPGRSKTPSVALCGIRYRRRWTLGRVATTTHDHPLM